MIRRPNQTKVEIAKGDRVRVYPQPVREPAMRRGQIDWVLHALVAATLIVWGLLGMNWLCACLW